MPENAAARAIPSFVVFVALMGGCATVAPPPPTELPEERPGYIVGYLQPNELPDSRALLTPPPAAGSAAFTADEEGYRATRAQVAAARQEIAAARVAGSVPRLDCAAEANALALDR